MLPDRHSENSGLHLRRALLFAAVGYAYVAVVLALLIGTVAWLASVGLGSFAWLALSGLIFYIVVALLVGIAPAEGRRVAREECPELFRAIDRARAELRAPAVDAVFLTHDMNAGVLERPRFGIVGWTQRFLMVGLPLLHALPPDEFRAILAHEFAHLSRQHSRSRRMLARAEVTWAALVFGFTASFRWTSFLFIPFFRWYTPRLEALAHQSSRAHEFESDRLAARAAGADVQGRALLRLAVSIRRLGRVVAPRVFRGSLEADAPRAEDFVRLLEGVREPAPRAEVSHSVRAALRDRTLDSHSHPSLADRLEALRTTPGEADVADTVGPRAVDAFLGGAAPALTAEVGELWAEAAAPIWRQCNMDARIWMEARGLAEPPRDALWAHARWAARCEPADVAIPLLRRVPERAESRVLLAGLLLQQEEAAGREEAVRLLEAECLRESLQAVEANDALEQFYADTGWTRDLRRCRERRIGLRQAALRIVHDRATIAPADTLRPCPLPPGARETLVAALKEFTEVRRAYLVQKRTRDPDGAPSLVLAVEMSTPWYRFTSGAHSREVCDRLLARVQLPEPLDLIVPVEGSSSLRRRLRRIAGAEVYPVDGRPVPAVPVPEWSAPPRLALVTGGRAWFAGVLLVMGIAGVSAAPDPEPRAWADALPELREAARKAPNDPEARRDLARALVETERWDEARPALEAAVPLNPGDADLRNSLGWVLAKGGNPEASLPLLREAIRIDPEHDLAYHNLGWALAMLNRPEEAEGHYRQVVRLTPENAAAHAGLGWVILQQSRLADAEREFRAAARLDAANADAHLGLAAVHKSRSELGAAVAAYREAARLAPGRAEIWAEIGQLEHLRGRFPESSAAFATTDSIAPRHFEQDEYRRGMWEASRAGRTYVPPES